MGKATELYLILTELDVGEKTLNEAHDAILRLFSVSVSLPVDNDIKIFADYITKYFKWDRNDDLYKSKQTGDVLPQSVIYRMWLKGNEH